MRTVFLQRAQTHVQEESSVLFLRFLVLKEQESVYAECYDVTVKIVGCEGSSYYRVSNY